MNSLEQSESANRRSPASGGSASASASAWKWNGRYPVRCRILDVAGHEVMPGIVAKTPKASRPHIGKLGTARRIRFGEVEITLDDGGMLKGSECWWLPMPNGICRYCSNPVSEADAVVTHSYWQGMKFVCHKACKVAGEKAEALECQTIDADCNDCRHFRRGQLVGKEVWSGHCQKYDRETRAYPKKWTGRECFEHRRAEAAATRDLGKPETL